MSNLAAPRRTSPHLAAPRRTSPHLAAPRRTSPHLAALFSGLLVLLFTFSGWSQETPEVVPPELRLKSHTQNYNYGGGSSYSGNWYGWTWSGSGGWSGWHNINWNSTTGGSERYGGNYSGSSTYPDWGSYIYSYYYDVITTWPAPPALGTMVYTNSWNWTYPDGQGGTVSDANGGSETYPDIAQPGGFPWRYAQTYKFEPYGYGDQDPEGQWSWTNSWSWNVSDSTRTRIDLHTGGATNSTAQALFVLTVSAYNAETWEAVDPTVIQVRGTYADSNGVVALTLSDNQIYDVTPTLPAAYSNYYFYVDNPAAIRPQIWMDFDDDLLEMQLGYASRAPAGLAASPVLYGRFTNGPNDITDKHVQAIVGQRISLYLRGVDAAPTATYDWRISGDIVSDAVLGNNSGRWFTNVVKTNLGVDFYWVRAGTYSVRCAIGMAGKTNNVTTTFIVHQPVVDLVGSITGQVNADKVFVSFNGVLVTDEHLHFGSGVDEPPDPHGIKFGFRRVDLSVPLSSFEFVSAQTGTNFALWNFTLNNKGTLTGSGLDLAFPYHAIDSAKTNDTWFDSPGVVIDITAALMSTAGPVQISSFQAKAGDQYRMHLLFRPGLPGAIFVPLRMVEWKWEGAAAKNTSQWTLIGNPIQSILQNNVAVPFSEFPAWTNRFNDGSPTSFRTTSGQHTIP